MWYKKTGAAWGLVYQPDLPTSKLIGQVTDAQIAAVAASKITGTISAGQIGNIPSSQIVGTFPFSQISGVIADGQLPTRIQAASTQPADLNNVNTNGWYFANGSLNIPTGSSGQFLVEFIAWGSSSYGVMVAYGLNDNSVWRRRRYNDVYDPWVQVSPITAAQISAGGGEVSSAKGAASGYAPLDASAHLPEANVPLRLAQGTQQGGIGVADWNNAKQSGWYDGQGAANAPIPTVWLLGEVIAHRGVSSAYITQRVWQFVDGSLAAQQTQWQRQCIGDVWQPWVTIRHAETYGTSFPASPQDGDHHTLVDSTTNPSYSWRCRYNSAITDAYKWVYVGGTPYYWAEASGVGRQNLTINTWEVSPAVSSFTLPRAGKYRYSVQANIYSYANTSNYLASGVNGAIYTPYSYINQPVPGGWAVADIVNSDTFGGGAPAAGSVFVPYIQTSNISNQSVQFVRYQVVPERLA